MAITPEAFAAKLGAVVVGVKVAQKTFVRQGAAVVTTSVFASMAATGVGSHRLRNVGKGGARLGVKSAFPDIGGSPGATIKATGPWGIIENNTPAHEIQPRSEDVLALRFPDGGFAAYANHPGTKGKHTWAKGAAAARKPVSALWQREMAKTVTTLF